MSEQAFVWLNYFSAQCKNVFVDMQCTRYSGKYKFIYWPICGHSDPKINFQVVIA